MFTSPISFWMFSGSRALCRVQKLPGWRFLCGSLPQWGEGRPPDCVEVQQCYRTLSAMQHQLLAVVSGHHAHTHTHTQPARMTYDPARSFSAALWWTREAVLLTQGQGELPSCYSRFGWALLNLFFFWSLSSLGTTIAAAVGGVVLFFILLGLLFFYLRRQKKLKRKETLRRILQEHEVGGDRVLLHLMLTPCRCLTVASCSHSNSWWNLWPPAVRRPIRLRCASWKRQSWRSWKCWVLGRSALFTRWGSLFLNGSIVTFMDIVSKELFSPLVSGGVGSWWGKCENTSSH